MTKTKANPVSRRMDANRKARRFSKSEVDELLSEAAPETVEKPAAETEAPPLLRAIEVPLAESRPELNRFRHVDARLDAIQGDALTRIYRALDRTDARLASGRHVDNAADAVRWLLEQVACGL